MLFINLIVLNFLNIVNNILVAVFEVKEKGLLQNSFFNLHQDNVHYKIENNYFKERGYRV